MYLQCHKKNWRSISQRGRKAFQISVDGGVRFSGKFNFDENMLKHDKILETKNEVLIDDFTKFVQGSNLILLKIWLAPILKTQPNANSTCGCGNFFYIN